MSQYHNYVFDLYGTLIDIHTDESRPALWRTMAELYGRYGVLRTPDELRREFLILEKAARDRVRSKLNTDYPEIRIEHIFLQLRDEACRHHEPEFRPDDDTWAQVMANVFRSLSTSRRRLFPDVIKTLTALRERGDRVFLLSNAQRVFTMPEMESLGLVPLFDGIYISSDCGLCKPDPRFFRLLLDREELSPEETVMIGNEEPADMGIARACGVRGVLFDGTTSPSDIRRQYRALLSL